MSVHSSCRRRTQLGALATAVVLLAGCAVGPDFRKPDAGLQQVALVPRGQASAENTAPVPLDWWQAFGDPVLDQLQRRALAGNLDLRAAQARVEASEARLGIVAAALKPSVQASAGVTRNANSSNGTLAALGASTEPYSMWQVGAAASWELDLWGHARRLREGAAANMDAVYFGSAAVRVSVSASVARQYLLLRSVQQQLRILDQNVDIASQLRDKALSRERNGVATRYEAASATAQLARERAQRIELQKQRYALLNALALLVGEPPRSLDGQLGKPAPLPALPARIPLGLSSTLAQRRPDIRQAEARLHAAVAAIGAAKADFYPRIGLTGTLDMLAFEHEDVGDWASRQFMVGPSIHLPIFQGGRLTRTLELRKAQQREAAIDYRNTVLAAWGEIDDALNDYALERRRGEQLDIASASAGSAFHVQQRAYRQGAADYVSVLQAQQSLLDAEQAQLLGQAQAALALVALYRAVGGGWDPSAPVSPAAASADRGTQRQ